MKQVNRKHNRSIFGAMPLEDGYRQEDADILKVFWEHLYKIYKIFNNPNNSPTNLLNGLDLTSEELSETSNSMISLAMYGKFIMDTRLNVYSLIDDITCFRNKYTSNQHPISELFNYSSERSFEFLRKLDNLLRRNGGSYKFPFYYSDIKSFKDFMLFRTSDKAHLINKDYDFYPTYGKEFERAFFNVTFCIYHMLQLHEIGITIKAPKELEAVLGSNFTSFRNELFDLLNSRELHLGVYYESYDYGLEGNYEFRVTHDHDNEW